MTLRNRLGLFLLALAVAGGLLYGFLPRPIPVDVAAVVRAPLKVTVEEEGKTRVRERYVVFAPVAGQLARIPFKVGDAVRQGEVLALITPAPAAALDPRSRAQALGRLRAAEAALASAADNARAARAQASLARQNLTRLKNLRAAGFVSAQALDQALAEVERSEAAQAAAEHAVEVARYDRETARAALVEGEAGARAASRFTVRAPVSGKVLQVMRESEGPVSAGQPLLELGDPSALEVVAEVLSSQAVRIAPGGRVTFERWGGEMALEGRVRRVEPTGFTKVSALGVEEQRVRVIADFTSPRELWQNLGDGFRVEARFIVWEGRDVLQIPASSLFRHNGGWAVFRLRHGRAELVPVTLGQRAGLMVEVLAGLEVGDRVITHPNDKVQAGSRVTPRQAGD